MRRQAYHARHSTCCRQAPSWPASSASHSAWGAFAERRTKLPRRVAEPHPGVSGDIHVKQRGTSRALTRSRDDARRSQLGVLVRHLALVDVAQPFGHALALVELRKDGRHVAATASASGCRRRSRSRRGRRRRRRRSGSGRRRRRRRGRGSTAPAGSRRGSGVSELVRLWVGSLHRPGQEASVN